ncbi:MAG: acyl-CoA thioesterase [Gammaproteobacteria bacterium]
MPQNPTATTALLQELIGLLSLERLEDNMFRGSSRNIGANRVYGGQVLGQAIQAAQYTVEGRDVHSFHAYFLREGNCDAPIVYVVDRNRDGGSFSSRRVVAIQHGQPICTLAASFHRRESGLDRQHAAPRVSPPEQLPTVAELGARHAATLDATLTRYATKTLGPFELRPAEPDFMAPGNGVPYRNLWFRIPVPVPDDELLQRAILAYLSDQNMLGTTLDPHRGDIAGQRVQMASLDHAMWFHRPFRIDEWMLYASESPNLSAGRGLARGSIYRRDGTLVASTMQEGMVRVVSPA